METRNHRGCTYTSSTAARANRPRGWDAKPRASKLLGGDREAAGLPAPKEGVMTERAKGSRSLHQHPIERLSERFRRTACLLLRGKTDAAALDEDNREVVAVTRDSVGGLNEQKNCSSQRRHPAAVALIFLGVLVIASSVALGATWTTDVDGHSQDANGYDRRCDVYVNAAGFDPAVTILYVRVVNSSGKIVLSEPRGTASGYLEVTPPKLVNGGFTIAGPLCPYDESSNGIYKVEVCPDTQFKNSNTFTDNFSVRLGDPGISKMCHTLIPGSVHLLAYTIEVTNYGGDSLGVTVEDVLPSVLTNATYTLDGTPKGNWPPSNVVDLGTVVADASHVIQIYVDVPASLTTIGSNTATVSSTSIDTNTGNNSTTCTNAITGTPSIGVTKTSDPTSVSEPGGSVTFTVVVENTWGVPLTLISLLDDVHGDLDGQGTISLPAALPVGGSFTGSFSATVSGNAGDSETTSSLRPRRTPKGRRYMLRIQPR